MRAGKIVWKKGRGKLGIFKPLLGKWVAEADSEMGKAICTRIFTSVLDGKYVQMNANWLFGDNSYDEIALIGIDASRKIHFWSFTSDGKQSQGDLADVSELHPQAIGFEAQMPSGLGRMAYWPDETEGFHWVVESKNKQGWRRFVTHHYRWDGD